MSAAQETDLSGEERAELDRVVSTLSNISSDLVRSYESLSQKAERVEQELYQANQKLEERVSELEAILEALPTGVLVRDAEGMIVRANDAASNIFGCATDSLIGETDSIAAPPNSGEPREITREDGSKVIVSGKRSTMRTPSGKEFGTVEILDDQTELTRLTERVHRMDKMASLGTMAAGIAHEIRNPMNAIKGYADLLLRTADEAEERESRWARNISAGVGEVDAIIGSMLTFADPEPLKLASLDSEELIRSAIGAATVHLGEDERWSVKVNCYALEFVGDEIKLRQAIRNLVSNAIDAQPEGGPVEIDLYLDQDELVIAISDAGPGVPRELVSKLADPFFTTRAEGTGLGLTLAHTIAQLHGGGLHVSAEPSPLGGARLSLRIPFVPTPE